ncbi:MAG: sialidase family protein [Acidobacteriota bacterium]
MKRISITAWTLFLAAGLAVGQQKVKLGLHLEEGRAYGLRMVQEQGAKLGVVLPVSSPAGSGSAQPNLALGSDGQVYLSWQEPAGEGETALRFSVWEGASWSAPRTIAQGSGWFVNWADFPSMAALPDGSLAAHWLVKSASATYAYDVHIARSTDGGESWHESVVPHRDGTPTEHGFVSLFPERDGLLGAIWLDGRQMASEASGGGQGQGAIGSMTLRYAALTPDGQLRDEAVLDSRVCECCQTSAARTGRGVVVAYRDRSEEEVRDIYAVTRIQGQWSDPRPIARDNWAINGCPVNGPSVSALGERVAVAWFSQSDQDPKVQAAFSSDGGESFGPAIRIDSGQPIGRVDVVLLEDGSALVSRLEWVEGEDNPAILVRQLSPDGQLEDDLRIADSGAARSTGFPQMIRSGNQLFFAWTDTSRPSQVRTARLNL